MCKNLARLLTIMVVTATLSCCTTHQVLAQSPASAAAAQPVGRLIVKLHQPADEVALMRLLTEKLPAPERIAFFRAISNDMYVLNLLTPATKDDLPRVIEQLIATDLFEYVEEDRMMTINKPAK